MPNAKNHTNQYLISAAVIIVLIAAGFLWSRSNRAPVAPVTQTNNATTTEKAAVSAPADDRQVVTQASGESVTADDQPAGMTANASFKLSRESWVGVRDAQGIMGVSRFGADATSGTIELMRATMPAETYTIVIFADDGNRTFDLYADPLVEGASASFKAQ